MKPKKCDGKNEWKFASATPSLHFHSFIKFFENKITNEYLCKNKGSHYTQIGILPFREVINRNNPQKFFCGLFESIIFL